jgi:hypothetical protein
MTGSKQTTPDKPPADDKADASPSPPDKKSGRVTFDARGNAVWEWSMSTGIFGRDVDSERLKKLEAPDLEIADDLPQKAKAFGTSPDQRGPGFDPYNTHAQKPVAVQPKSTGSDPYNNLSASPGRKGDGTGKPTDLRRLSEWIKRQRELQKKGD